MKNQYTFIIRFVYFKESQQLYYNEKDHKLANDAYLRDPIEYTAFADTFEEARTKALEYGQAILRNYDTLTFMRVGIKDKITT